MPHSAHIYLPSVRHVILKLLTLEIIHYVDIVPIDTMTIFD